MVTLRARMSTTSLSSPRPQICTRGIVEMLEPRFVCAAGDLDTTFHGTGSNFTEFFSFPLRDEFAAAVQQPDGKIVAVGTSTDGATRVVFYPRDIFEDVGIAGFEQGPQFEDTSSSQEPDIVVARFNAD